MHAVILAAGRGARMGELTASLPKPLLEVAGKTLLEHKFDVLPEDVREIIIVVGYLGDMLRERFGDTYRDKRLRYVTQENVVGGTAEALWCARDLLTDRFLVMMGDDIYTAEDIARCSAVEYWALLVQKANPIGSGGKVIRDTDGHIMDIIEVVDSLENGFVGTNLFTLDTRLFEYPLVPKAPGSGEMGLPQTVLAAARAFDIPFLPIETTRWIQITAPEDLAQAAEKLGNR